MLLLALLLIPPVAERRPDPFPIRRVLLAADAMPPVAEGPWRAMDATAFERAVQAAAAVGSRSTCRLANAEYTATLVGHDLVGTARLQFRGKGDFEWPALSFAIQPVDDSVKASKPGPHVVWRMPSDAMVKADWSLAGHRMAGGVQLEMHSPPSGVAVLNLTLPSGHTPHVAGALVTQTSLTEWRIAFGGLAKLLLTIANSTTAMPSVKRFVKYAISPAGIEGDYEFDFEPLAGSGGPWRFRLDPGVRIIAVSTPAYGRWRIDNASQLNVDAPPGVGGRVTIRASLPMPRTNEPWHCCGVQASGIHGEDAIELRVDSELKWELIDAGDYTLSKPAAAANTPSLTLQSTWRSGAERRSPSLRFKPGPLEFRLRQQVDWSLGVGHCSAEAVLTLTVVRGPLAAVPLRVPVDYRVKSVRLVPDDGNVQWTPNAMGGILEPQVPWATGRVQDVRCELVPRNPRAGGFTPPRVIVSTAAASEASMTLTPRAGSAIVWNGVAIMEPRFNSSMNPELHESVFCAVEAPPVPVSDATVRQPRATSCRIDDAALNVTADTAILTIRGTATGRLAIAPGPGETVLAATVAGRQAMPRVDGNVLIVTMPDATETAFELCILKALEPGPVTRMPVFAAAINGETVHCNHSKVASPSLTIDANAAVWIIDRRLVTMAIVVITAASLMAFLILTNHRWRAMILLATVALLALLPLLFGAAWLMRVGPALMLLFATRLVIHLRRQRGVAMAPLLAICAIMAMPHATHSDDASETVYLKPQEHGTVAFVRPATFEKLNALRRISVPFPTIPSAVIEGDCDGVALHLKATLQVNSTATEPVVMPLPAQDWALEKVELDGEAVVPVMTAHRAGVRIVSPGTHRVTLSASLPVARNAGASQLKWAWVGVPSTALKIRFPAAVHEVQAFTRHGAQRIDALGKHVTLYTDLGAVDEVSVRWKSSTASKPAFQGRDITLYDLSTPTHSVIFAAQLSRINGPADALALQLPAETVFADAVIRTATGRVIPVAARTIAADSVTLDLAEPLAAPARLIVRLVPVKPLTRTPTLSAVKLTGLDAEAELAIRTGTTTVERWDRVSGVESALEEFEKTWSTFPELQSARSPPAKAWRGGNPVVRPRIARE